MQAANDNTNDAWGMFWKQCALNRKERIANEQDPAEKARLIQIDRAYSVADQFMEGL